MCEAQSLLSELRSSWHASAPGETEAELCPKSCDSFLEETRCRVRLSVGLRSQQAFGGEPVVLVPFGIGIHRTT